MDRKAMKTAASVEKNLIPASMKRQANLVEIVDESGEIVAATPTRRIRLRSLRQIADEVARVYRGMREGQIKHEDGTRLTYVLVSLGKITESAVVEERLRKVEERLLAGNLVVLPADDESQTEASSCG